MKKYYIIFLLSFIFSQASALNLGWAKMLPGSESYPNGVEQDTDGNIFIAGYFWNTVDFDPGPGAFNMTANGKWDAYLLKLDKFGNFIWAKQFGGIENEEFPHMTLDTEGNVYLICNFMGTIDADPNAGTFNLISNGWQDVFLSKLDNNGNFLWAKQFGSTENDLYSRIVIDNSSNVVFIIDFKASMDADPNAGVNILTLNGSQDLAVIKLSSQGAFIWAKQVCGGYVGGSSIAIDNNNDIVYAGYYADTVDFDPGASMFNLQYHFLSSYVSRLDSNGNFMWVKSINGSYESHITNIYIDNNGNITFGGEFKFGLDTDPGPTVDTFNSAGGYDLFLIKLNSTGDFVWSKQIGNVDYEALAEHVIDNQGNIYFTGFFESDMLDMDPGPGTDYISSAGLADMVITKLDSNGNYVWTTHLIGNGAVIGYGIDLDNQNNIIVCGSFKGTTDFDPGASVYNMTDTVLSTCIFKLIHVPLSLNQITGNNLINIYPNPAHNGMFQLQTTLKVSWKVYDVKGNFVLNGSSNKIDISRFAKGQYIIQTSVGNDVFYSKILYQ